jgi:t-SNARE complex subunit (syntaxin)
VERRAQEEIANDMESMMSRLKEGVNNIADDMQADSKVVDTATELTEENLGKIEAARKQIESQNESGIGFCATMSIIITVTFLFIATYLFMKIFPK